MSVKKIFVRATTYNSDEREMTVLQADCFPITAHKYDSKSTKIIINKTFFFLKELKTSHNI